MPHLAPLSWTLVSLLFWLTLLSFITMTWWSQTPTFPRLSSSLPATPSTPWRW